MTNNKKCEIDISAWESKGLLVERYIYSWGTVEPLPKHSHSEYQFGLSCDCQGEYYYRGAHYQIPLGNLSIIHSGEVHAPSQRTFLPDTATFWMMHAQPSWLQTTASELAEKPTYQPFFSESIVGDRELVSLFLQFHRTVAQKAFRLERDTSLLLFFSQLIARCAQNCPAIRPLKSSRAAVIRVREFLNDNYACNVSLEELAKIAGLSRSYLCRAFSKEVGIPPHAYQTQVRIDRAKRILARGNSLAVAAAETGFYDQSHFGWHFKHLVGVTPGIYAKKTQ
jgi:AraC-like DNA-binding protein